MGDGYPAQPCKAGRPAKAAFGVSQFFQPAELSGKHLTMPPCARLPDVVVNGLANPFERRAVVSGGLLRGVRRVNYYGGNEPWPPPTGRLLAALLNQALVRNSAISTPHVSPRGQAQGFTGLLHLRATFAHVGFGSPNLNQLFLQLGHTSVGAVSASASTVSPWALISSPVPPLPTSIPADGTSAVSIVVTLRDANGNGRQR